MADLSSKKAKCITGAVQCAENLTEQIEALRECLNAIKAKNYQNAQNGITDADFLNSQVVGVNTHVDGNVFRAWFNAGTALLAYWDDLTNANGNPDKKFHSMTPR